MTTQTPLAGPEDEDTHPIQETPRDDDFVVSLHMGPEDEETGVEERGADPRGGTKASAGPEEEDTRDEMAGEGRPRPTV